MLPGWQDLFPTYHVRHRENESRREKSVYPQRAVERERETEEDTLDPERRVCGVGWRESSCPAQEFPGFPQPRDKALIGDKYLVTEPKAWLT